MSHIALVLSGGVSLGTYVAGAVTEILHALENNRKPNCTVDVIAGSSAGALAAALAARSLVVNPSLLPWIERTWVEMVDAEVLLEPGRPDRAGWLDGSVLDELSRALITAEPAADDRPSRAVGSPLSVGIALSNLLGVKYRFPYGFLNAPERFYGARLYHDALTLEIPAGTGPADPLWERMRRAAVASASFPLAFPPRPLTRHASEYPGASLPAPRLDMWYADGGLFQNEPVGLAKRLVEARPEHRSEDWCYILVDPYMEREPSEKDARGPHPPRSPLEAADCVARAVLGQGAALDWIRANKINARLEILEALVERLPGLSERLTDPDAVDVGRAIGDLAERVAEMKVAVRREPRPASGDPALDYLEENLRRIADDPRFAPVLRRLETRAARTRLAKLVFVLEAAGGLRDKEPMPLYLVAPPEGEALSGEFLANFGGFFRREWRENDFRAGRRDARALLETHLADRIEYRPGPPEAYEVRELKAGFDRISPEARRKLERYLDVEAERTLRELDVGPIGALFGWLWRPAVRRWARRSAMAALETLS